MSSLFKKTKRLCSSKYKRLKSRLHHGETEWSLCVSYSHAEDPHTCNVYKAHCRCPTLSWCREQCQKSTKPSLIKMMIFTLIAFSTICPVSSHGGQRTVWRVRWHWTWRKTWRPTTQGRVSGEASDHRWGVFSLDNQSLSVTCTRFSDETIQVQFEGCPLVLHGAVKSLNGLST